MLEKPELCDDRIVAGLRAEYGLDIVEVAFLPLGADRNTAVYRATAECGVTYFVKLRRGDLDDICVALTKYLSDQGIEQVIAPLVAKGGGLWTTLDEFKLFVYPYVEGCDGYEVSLSEQQWVELGRTLKRIHMTALPARLRSCIRQETYDRHARDRVRAFVEEAERGGFVEPVAAQVAALLRERRGQVLDLVERAGRLAQLLRGRRRARVVCHSDLHAGNVLIADDGALYLVDWDEPILAPQERDLMYAGGGLMGGWRPPEEEEALFYQGYGEVEIDRTALAYYRYERIVQDIAAFCEQLLGSDEGGADREQSLGYLMSNWEAGGVIEIAYRSDMCS